MPKGSPYSKEDLERIRSRTSKYCSYCYQQKSLDEFYNCEIKADGKTSYCKECKKKEDFRKKYGITTEQYDEMYKSQNGLCKICGAVPKGTHNQKVLHTDHDHVTGKVRGLLCAQCNMALGGFKNSINLLIKAAEYLHEFAGTDKQTAANVVLLKQKEPIKRENSTN